MLGPWDHKRGIRPESLSERPTCQKSLGEVAKNDSVQVDTQGL